MHIEAIPSTTATVVARGEGRGRVRLRWGVLGALLGLSWLACLWSLADGAAALVAWQAGRVSADAPGPGAVPGGADDQAIRRLLSIARRLEPGNPRYAEQLALHLELLAGQSLPRSDLEQRLLTQARGLYIEGIRRRPTWALGLTSVLRTDFKRQQWGREFARLYARAADLARSEPVPLRALVDLGLVAWPVLDPDARGQALQLLRYGLRVDARGLLERAYDLRRGPLVAPLIAADPALMRLWTDIGVRAAGPR